MRGFTRGVAANTKKESKSKQTASLPEIKMAARDSSFAWLPTNRRLDQLEDNNNAKIAQSKWPRAMTFKLCTPCAQSFQFLMTGRRA